MESIVVYASSYEKRALLSPAYIIKPPSWSGRAIKDISVDEMQFNR